MSITVITAGTDQLCVEVGEDFVIRLNGAELYRTSDFSFNLPDDAVFWALALDAESGYGCENPAYALPSALRDELAALIVN